MKCLAVMTQYWIVTNSRLPDGHTVVVRDIVK